MIWRRLTRLVKAEPTAAERAAEAMAAREEAAEATRERAKDLQARLDEQHQAEVAAGNEAFIAQLLRDGYVWPGESSPSLEEHRERLRDARGGRRW